jgi:hypothetical protein
MAIPSPILILRDLDIKKIGTLVFGEIRNMVLEENVENKIIREIDYQRVVLHIGASKQYPA